MCRGVRLGAVGMFLAKKGLARFLHRGPRFLRGKGLARLLRAQQSGRCGNALERLALCGVYSLNIFKKPRFDGGLRRPLLMSTPPHNFMCLSPVYTVQLRSPPLQLYPRFQDALFFLYGFRSNKPPNAFHLYAG